MTSGKDDEEFFRQRGFGVKIGFGERPALIVIDMLKGFTDADDAARRQSRHADRGAEAADRRRA